MEVPADSQDKSDLHHGMLHRNLQKQSPRPNHKKKESFGAVSIVYSTLFVGTELI